MSKQLIYIILIVTTIVLPCNLFAQIKTYQFEQIDSLQNLEKRNLVVFIHTDWCKYCQVMLNTTLKNDSIIKILNQKYYFISLNAEEKRDIIYRKRTFIYKPTGNNTGINQLANQFVSIDNKIAYPTLCFLNSNNEIIFQYSQYINSVDLGILLKKLVE